MEKETTPPQGLAAAELKLINAISTMIYFIPFILVIEIFVAIIVPGPVGQVNASVALTKMFTGIIWLVIIFRIIRTVENSTFYKTLTGT